MGICRRLDGGAAGRGSAGGPGPGAHPGRSMLRIDCTAVLAAGLARQNSLRDCVATLRQLPQVRSRRLACPPAGKPSPAAALLVAPEIAPGPGPPAAPGHAGVRFTRKPSRRVQGKGVCAAVRARLSGAEQRSELGPLVCAEGHTRASSSGLRQLSERRSREFCRGAELASSAGKSTLKASTARVARRHGGPQAFAPPTRTSRSAPPPSSPPHPPRG